MLADQVKQWLLDAILHGTYPPDSRIVETAVARELGTSQAPVREALRGLEALGIVEIAPFHGARVRRIEALTCSRPTSSGRRSKSWVLVWRWPG